MRRSAAESRCSETVVRKRVRSVWTGAAPSAVDAAMNDDYFTRLDRQLAQLTMDGAHVDPTARWRSGQWSAVQRGARRTVVAVALALVLAALLVIEFPGSATGSVHRRSGSVVAAADQGPISISTAVRRFSRDPA